MFFVAGVVMILANSLIDNASESTVPSGLGLVFLGLSLPILGFGLLVHKYMPQQPSSNDHP